MKQIIRYRAVWAALAVLFFPYSELWASPKLTLTFKLSCPELSQPDVRVRVLWNTSGPNQTLTSKTWRRTLEERLAKGEDVAPCATRAANAIRGNMRWACSRGKAGPHACSSEAMERALLPLRIEARTLASAFQDQASPKQAVSQEKGQDQSLGFFPIAKNENCADCGKPPLLRVNNSISNISAAASSAAACSQMKPGEAREPKLGDKPTNMDGFHKLTRLDDKTYEAALNLRFLAPSEAMPEEAAKIEAEMRQKTQECMEQINPRLLGPDQMRLKLRLTSESEKNPPPMVKLQIEQPGFASTSVRYARDIDCPSIAHELMHLLGLVDEYDENAQKRDGFTLNPVTGTWQKASSGKPIWDCRVPGTPDSLMRSREEAFRSAFGTQLQFKCTCDFECKPTNWDGKGKCPQGYLQEAGEVISHGKPPSFQRIDAKTLVSTRPLMPPKKASLLEPAHFFAIVFPGCPVLKDFYSCAKNAYRTSKENGGEGCLETSPACEAQSTKWLQLPK